MKIGVGQLSIGRQLGGSSPEGMDKNSCKRQWNWSWELERESKELLVYSNSGLIKICTYHY